ncbi:Hypothetical protein BN69_2598 [Methylocystis sp. SC2]|nr:Hypothetical protein BN69_2598 [Methylocystis sp. SC2]
MKKAVRPFTVEYRSKRGRSPTRSGGAFRYTDRSAERASAGKDMRGARSAWRSLFKQEARSI